MISFKKLSYHIAYLSLEGFHQTGHLKGVINIKDRALKYNTAEQPAEIKAWITTFLPCYRVVNRTGGGREIVPASIWALRPRDKSVSKMEETPRASALPATPNPWNLIAFIGARYLCFLCK